MVEAAIKGVMRMPIVQINVKLTDEERALLAKRAKRQKLSEADYLRFAMSFEAFSAGDPDAVKILGGRLRAKFWPAYLEAVAVAPVKA